MNKKILFVENSSSFLVNAIISNLEMEGFECGKIGYDVNRIDALKNGYTSFFLFIENETAHRDDSTLIYLRDICLAEDKKIFMMGDQANIDEVSKILNDKVIWDVFLRPINAKDVTELVLGAYDKAEKLGDRKNILVVDDSGTYLHTIKEWLEPKYKITMVNSATSAITYLGKNTPDLVLLDYEMPICNGPMMLQMIRADVSLSDIPVMFLTGKGDRESIQKVLSLKPQGYLLKTLPKEKLVESLDDFFCRQKQKNALH